MGLWVYEQREMYQNQAIRYDWKLLLDEIDFPWRLDSKSVTNGNSLIETVNNGRISVEHGDPTLDSMVEILQQQDFCHLAHAKRNEVTLNGLAFAQIGVIPYRLLAVLHYSLTSVDHFRLKKITTHGNDNGRR